MLASSDTTRDSKAFRPGLTSLRAQKLHWTLTEMDELDSNYTFKVKGSKQKHTASVTMDSKTLESFQNACRVTSFKKPRVAYLYGKFLDTEAAVEEKARIAQEKAKASTSKTYGQTKKKMNLSDLDMEEDTRPRQRVRVDFAYEPAQEVDSNGRLWSVEIKGIQLCVG